MSLRLWLAGGGVHPVHPAGLAILSGRCGEPARAAVLLLPRVPGGRISELLGDLGRGCSGAPGCFRAGWTFPCVRSSTCCSAFFVWATWVAMGSAFPAWLPGLALQPCRRRQDAAVLRRRLPADLGVVAALVVGVGARARLLVPLSLPVRGAAGLLGRSHPSRSSATWPRASTARPAPGRARPASPCTPRPGSATWSARGARTASPPVRSPGAWRFARPPSPACGSVRPRSWAIVTVGFLVVLGAFRLAGHWHSGVSEAEFARRLREIRSPAYGHPGASPPPVQGSGVRGPGSVPPPDHQPIPPR